MGAKHILIANSDLRTLGEQGRALGLEAKITLVTNSAEALAAMAEQPCDVIVADAALPQVSGLELLDQIHTKYPKTIRILLANEPDKELAVADVRGSHLILTKPCDNAVLKGAIERALAINQWLTNDKLRELVGRLRTFPIVPSLYLEVVNALKNPNTTPVEIGSIIAKDMAMMTKLLQVTNSACFGLPRKISDPVEAVGILGFETVKTMVMTLKLLSQYDHVKPVYFSIDRLWRHSTEVARLARRIVREQSDDHALAESAFAAGLMHDVGKLILAANFDDQYSRAQDMARKRQIPMVEVETEIFGASHGEIGAYLLGLWGMPLDLVETAALHHHPSRSLSGRFTALTAVHVANALSYEISPEKQGFVPTQIDEEYLAGLGLADHLALWRQAVQDPDSGGTQFRAKTGNTIRFQKPAVSKPAPPPRQSKPVQTAPGPNTPWFNPEKKWLYIAMSSAVVILLGWVGTQALVNHAAEPSPEPPPPIATAPPVIPKTAPPAPAQSDLQPVVAEPVAKPAAIPAPVPSNQAPVAAAINPPPAPKPSAKDLAFAELHLQSIFYSANHPSAVISGQAVQTNDRLPAGAVVVEIRPSSVVLQFQQERRTLALK
jgi:putative nucleotidyltransferase with HDIG domain